MSNESENNKKITWIQVNFRMPVEEVAALKEVISEYSETLPNLSQSRIIRRGIAYEIRRIRDSADQYSYEATTLYESLTQILKELGWEKN